MIKWLGGKWSIVLMIFAGCGSPEIQPVDIFPEDNCSHCRMMISDQAFAAEIITAEEDVFKFDDIGCMERFRKQLAGTNIVATYVKDYDFKTWIPYNRAFIIRANIKTPMGSGQIAFCDSVRAKNLSEQRLEEKQ